MTPQILRNIFTICLYISLVGIVAFLLLKLKKIKETKDQTNMDKDIVQHTDSSMLSMSKSELSKSLTVRYFSLFTVSGFLLVFGFMGRQCLNNHLTMKPSVVTSFLLGLTGLVLFSLIEYALDLMVKRDGIFSANTVGLEALVYEDIKAKRGNMGKVRVSVNDYVIQFDAVTNAEVTLRKGAKVKIKNSLSDTCVVVE